MPVGGILSVLEVNALPSEQFEWIFGNVVEHCPEAASWVASKRPFNSVDSLKNAFDDYLDSLNTSGEKISLKLKER